MPEQESERNPNQELVNRIRTNGRKILIDASNIVSIEENLGASEIPPDLADRIKRTYYSIGSHRAFQAFVRHMRHAGIPAAAIVDIVDAAEDELAEYKVVLFSREDEPPFTS